MSDHTSDSVSRKRMSSEVADYGNVEETRADLLRAIEEHHPLKTIRLLYAKFVVASLRNKSAAADKMGVARRSIERWEKASD